MKKTIVIVLVISVSVLGYATYYFSSLNGEVASIQNSAVSSATSTKQTPAEASTRVVPQGFKEYVRQNYHFSILYPEATTITKEQGGTNGEALFVVFQDSVVEHRGFQIFAKPYGSQTITQATFKMDEPSGVIKNQQNISVAGAQGIMFLSSDPTVGALREIWFIKNGVLYEVTTSPEFDSWIQNILNTWQFI